MSALAVIQTLITYRTAISGRVWNSIDHLSLPQFVRNDEYSRGSIRNLRVHIANTDLNMLKGLKNLPDARRHMKNHEEYRDRASARTYWRSVDGNLNDFVGHLTEQELSENPVDTPGARWKVLLHLVNHGTDQRSTVLQKLAEFGAPTFDRDFSIWLANR